MTNSTCFLCDSELDNQFFDLPLCPEVENCQESLCALAWEFPDCPDHDTLISKMVFDNTIESVRICNECVEETDLNSGFSSLYGLLGDCLVYRKIRNRHDGRVCTDFERIYYHTIFQYLSDDQRVEFIEFLRRNAPSLDKCDLYTLHKIIISSKCNP